MGRFADLRPENEHRINFWHNYSRQAWALLTDVNYDLMDGKGKFLENQTVEGEPYPHLPSPNLSLVYENAEKISCSIGLGPSPQGDQIRIRMGLRGMQVEWRDVEPDQLESTMRTMLKWLMEQGMREVWFGG